MSDFLFHDALREVDPELADLIGYETERQARKLVMVPSESLAPYAVHEALASSFSHIYAEGYPKERTRTMTEAEILDYEAVLGNYRRYADPRYYKGVEYADVLEMLTRRRVAEAFATAAAPADQLYVNVQTLSGAPANTAVQYALLSPGDTLLSMALHVGGHLSHGSRVAYSGKTYNVVSYGVDEQTERLDYDAIRALALQTRPKLIIGGYTSYPWAPDWLKLRAIADEVGAHLLADIAHVAGLVVSGDYPNPVGIADAVTFTTHKTLNGPRGAVIITHKQKLGRKFDRAVFPGFQGGPHLETIAALAATMQIARTEQFRQLQHQTVRNAVALAEALQAEGVRVPYGGTDTHLLLFDCKTIVGPDGAPLMGDTAARILDIAGIVANRNTIPGDTTAAYPSGVRLGTPWITQRGLREPEMQRIAQIIARLLRGMQPYKIERRGREEFRARVDFDTLEAAKLDIAALATQAAAPALWPVCDRAAASSGYPHFYYLNDAPKGDGAFERLELAGPFVRAFVEWLTPSRTTDMADGDVRPVTLLEANGEVMTAGWLTRVNAKSYWLDVPTVAASRVMTWLRALVDGYVATDDVYGRLHVLDAVRDLGATPGAVAAATPESGPFTKPYFIGAWSRKEPAGAALPNFVWSEPQNAPLRKTHLNATHRAMGARMVPFGGWDMPVWYTGNLEEHRAVREAAGLFDVSHMGCWDVQGPEAATFLNMVLVNDVNYLDVGRSQYTAFFGVDGVPLDDLLVYRMGDAHYLLVVNAANNDKDWAWINAVLKGEVCIDPKRPWVKWQGEGVQLRDLRDPAAGADMRAELALQGPKSRAILQALGGTADDLAQVKRLPWAGITRVTLGDFDVIVSRTGYTGERVAYELFVHPDRLVDFWKALLEVGAPYSLKPCGLAARDSLRLEAGLPLYGHEMAGPLNLTMAEAGFGGYIKIYKAFFVGREAFIARDLHREGAVIRFGVPEKGPMPQNGDPVVDDKGKVVGFVTSCAIDTEGQQLGQAYVRGAYTDAGVKLAVLVSPRREPKPRAQLTLGDRTQLPVGIVVLSRFPKR
ncbi:MAG TPA: glycine cleavage system aminomethyltransferase GcvT [Anaerolineae bacterium]|nr:glycine cleavage system aminomethyltransferase GcvT [Anaerolineae bacterium]HQI83575.1 glycine cleavage system aminomethyltransferase GcvT [Anaerolineae bacterium]